jgi:hypothetical protein
MLQAAFSRGPLRGSVTWPTGLNSKSECSAVEAVQLEELKVLTNEQRKLKIRYQESSSENIAVI